MIKVVGFVVVENRLVHRGRRAVEKLRVGSSHGSNLYLFASHEI